MLLAKIELKQVAGRWYFNGNQKVAPAGWSSPRKVDTELRCS